MTAIDQDAGKRDAAVPATNGCTLPGAAIRGDVTASPSPSPTIDGALYLTAEVIWPEIWPALHNHELWGAGPDGNYHWRDQADGFYEENEVNENI
jgi:hypothetical protein